MEQEADNDVDNGDNNLNDVGMGLHQPWLFYILALDRFLSSFHSALRHIFCNHLFSDL